MPGLDGPAVLRQLRAEGQMRCLPLIVMTTLALPGDRERCLAAGADAYYVKPVSLPTLLASLEAHLRQREAQVGGTPD